MGRRGWRGDPPADDAEARVRIIDAAIRNVERRGARNTTLSDIAADLGVTRPTIYRHFATTDELLDAAAESALGGWTARIGKLTAGITDPTELVVEAIAYLVEWLPQEPLLTLLLETDRGRLVSRRMVLPDAVARSRIMLEHTRIDWAALGYRGSAMDDLVEYLLRMIQSMVVAPSDPPRSPEALRAYLRRWIAPVLAVRPAEVS
ncbi:MAG TPA: helix-turn-helix domain-containing protein [Mycobacterium sp.]|nr:helix-turn-helix domain-containing protein [Mycobacterium sp.]